MNELSVTSASDIVLTEAQAADFLQISPRTLQAWRVKGGGPNYVKVGRNVRYQRSALEKWMEGNSVNHTSDGYAK